jgi:hypothetical protein
MDINFVYQCQSILQKYTGIQKIPIAGIPLFENVINTRFNAKTKLNIVFVLKINS